MCEMIAKCSYFWIMSKYGTQGAYWSWQMWVVGHLGLAGKSITSSWLGKTICIRTRQTDRHVVFWDSNQYSTLGVPPPLASATLNYYLLLVQKKNFGLMNSTLYCFSKSYRQSCNITAIFCLLLEFSSTSNYPCIGYDLVTERFFFFSFSMWTSVVPITSEAKVPSSRSKHASVLHGQHLYLLGGRNGNVALKDFWKYHIGKYKTILIYALSAVESPNSKRWVVKY